MAATGTVEVRTKVVIDNLDEIEREIRWMDEKLRYQAARARWIHFQLEEQAAARGEAE